MEAQFEELTNSQWEIIEKLLDDQRERQHNLRMVLNAILWLNRTGLQWCELRRSTYPCCWQSMCYYFRKWKLTRVWGQLLDALTVLERSRQEREATLSLLAVDNQSVKKVAFLSLETGIGEGKCVNGRKRHIALDTLGLPWAIVVTAANVSDTAPGCQLVDRLHGKVLRLEKIAADHGYRTYFIEHVGGTCGWEVE